MAITIDSNVKESISLEEYLEFMEGSLDPLNQDQVLDSASKLKALANNQQFLAEKLNQELRNWRDFQPNNAYSAQTLTLGRAKSCFLRANMWAPLTKVENNHDWEKRLYAYSQPHDHNFSFLTVGYFGPGYKTVIYEYDPDSVSGYSGEKVNLRFLERTTLPQGKIMFYRASKDIHSQEPPEDFSISINLMIVSPEVSVRGQYWFDLDAGIIIRQVQNPASTRLMLCRLARYISNDETKDILNTIAKQHHFPNVRAAAYESLSFVESKDAYRIWRYAFDCDKSPLVKSIAEDALRNLSDSFT
ncbi:MAG: HEAT repeat domain-containing protein [Moorea sp. SIO2I5]|nr:HEAT repeat domain-containing protein [Moorena sp. SIO2I5]